VGERSSRARPRRETKFGFARSATGATGGAIGRVGVALRRIPALPAFYRNVTVGGPARCGRTSTTLLIFSTAIQPGRVCDRTTNLDGVPDGYRAMDEREAIKVLIDF
jgi:threonine dehydrogenase-like Zn-dependent dehydrogenase